MGVDRVLIIALAGLLVWMLSDVLLLIFVGLLLGIALDALATPVARRTPLPRKLTLVLVALMLVTGLGAFAAVIVPRAVGQIDQLWNVVAEAVEAAGDTVTSWGWPDVELDDASDISQGRLLEVMQGIVGQLAEITMTAIGFVGDLFVATAIGLFIAFDPAVYRRGFLALVPSRKRDWDAAITETGRALRWWFLGQLVSMIVLGVTVSLGLMLLGVELWLSLGLLTGLFTFVPILGPIIAGAPILLVSFTESTDVGLSVLVFYLLVQNVEGNFLVPYIQHRAVHLPPALLLAAMVVLGALFGLPGFILAAPLTVVGLVLVKKIYLEKADDLN
jgi:predicted PurR-regulated permease PerM